MKTINFVLVSCLFGLAISISSAFAQSPEKSSSTAKQTTARTAQQAALQSTTEDSKKSNGEIKWSDVDKSEFENVWYAGIGMGASWGSSTFHSSYGHGLQTNAHGQLIVGYRFSRLFSLDFSLSIGGVTTKALDCCANTLPIKGDPIHHSYWLPLDNRYNGDIPYYYPVTEDDGWYYNDVASRAITQRYTLQSNINILAFFNKSRYCRWLVEVSPRISAVNTWALHYGPNSSSGLYRSELRDSRWHFGYGAQASVSYSIFPKAVIALYGQIDFLTGRGFDAVPKYQHKENFLYDAGVKLTFAFGQSEYK